mmetsp:Transcript_370/g.1276  ORF Transcript_370/g.1276 Transcript_370/m.1276 type:complete len:201 (+) Transcript_370:544-1146(+)
MTPSAWMEVMSCPRSYASILERNGEGPRSTRTSLRIVYVKDGSPLPPFSTLSANLNTSQSKRMRRVIGTPPEMFAIGGPRPSAMSKLGAISFPGWFVRKPKEPKWNPKTGGVGPWNILLACKITPSPPKQTHTSIVPQSSFGIFPFESFSTHKAFVRTSVRFCSSTVSNLIVSSSNSLFTSVSKMTCIPIVINACATSTN